MVPHMICVLPFLTTACQVRRLRISVPLAECLVDGQKYFLPDTLPAPAGEAFAALPAQDRDQRRSAFIGAATDRKTWRASDLAEVDRLLGSP